MIRIPLFKTMASSDDLEKTAPSTSGGGKEIPAGDRPPLQGWTELWKIYGAYSFGMLIVVAIMGGMSAVGWLIWWLVTR